MKIAILIFFSLSFSQVFSEYSYAGANQSAMVGSVVSKTSSESGLFQNPASLAGLEKTILSGQATLYNQSYLSYNYLGLVYKLPILNNIGISYNSSSTNNSGTQLSSEKVVSFTKGIFLQKDKNSRLAFGYRLNCLLWEQGQSAGTSGDGSDGFPGHDVSTIGLDLGVIGGLREKYWIGGYLSNINSPIINGQNLPRKISISFGFSPLDKMYTNLSMERLLGRNDRQIKMGFKYDLNDNLCISSGVQSNPNRFGLGFEYNLTNGIIISYSVLTHHVMKETYNFEIKLK